MTSMYTTHVSGKQEFNKQHQEFEKPNMSIKTKGP